MWAPYLITVIYIKFGIISDVNIFHHKQLDDVGFLNMENQATNQSFHNIKEGS